MEKHVIKENDNTNTLLIYIPNFLDKENYDKIKYEVEDYDDWYCGYNYNNNCVTRKQKWFQTDKLSFCREWRVKYDRWKSFDYTKNLLDLQSYVEQKVNNIIDGYDGVKPAKYNSLLINYYENENNFITAHQDCKESFGESPTIAIYSLGDSRTIKLERTLYNSLARNKKEKDKNVNFNLSDNSLFIMGGGSQKYYCHAIDKEPDKKSHRYSFSFRDYINL